MSESKSIQDNITAVNEDLAEYIRKHFLQVQLMTRGVWKRGVGKQIIKLVVQGMNPSKFQAAVRQRLEFECIDSNPDNVVRAMNEELLVFKKAERVLSVKAQDGRLLSRKDTRRPPSRPAANKARPTRLRLAQRPTAEPAVGEGRFGLPVNTCGEVGHKKVNCPQRLSAPDGSTGSKQPAPATAKAQEPASRTRAQQEQAQPQASRTRLQPGRQAVGPSVPYRAAHIDTAPASRRWAMPKTSTFYYECRGLMLRIGLRLGLGRLRRRNRRIPPVVMRPRHVRDDSLTVFRLVESWARWTMVRSMSRRSVLTGLRKSWMVEVRPVER